MNSESKGISKQVLFLVVIMAIVFVIMSFWPGLFGTVPESPVVEEETTSEF